MIRDLTRLNNKRGKSAGRSRKINKVNKVEKTIRIVKETDFVQRDEFNNADEPMPEVTLRDIRQRKKEKNQEEKEPERRRVITLSKTLNQNDKDKLEDNVNEEENIPEESEPVKKSDDDIVNITDIRAARKKEKTKKRIKKFIALGIVVVFVGSAYGFRNKWVPKLEGILDKPHKTIVNDGETQKGNFPIELDDNSNVKITGFDNRLMTIDKNHIIMYDESGNEENNISHTYADPIAKTSGKRILLYDNGGNSFEVLTRKNQVYTKTTDNPILVASMASNSNVAVVTTSEKYVSCVTIYDSNGTEIYTWESNQRVMDVTFNDKGTGCYISAFVSEKGSLKSVVHYVKFDSTKEVMKSKKLDTLVLKAMPTNNNCIWVVGDDKFYKLDKNGNIIFEYDYDGELIDYDFSSTTAAVTYKGVVNKTGKLAAFNSDSDKNGPDSVTTIENQIPKKLKIFSNKIMLLSEKDISTYDTSGNKLATANVSIDYQNFTFFNENIYFLGCRDINKISFKTD